MTFREIISSVKKGDFAPVYILMGKEDFYIDRIVQALEASVVAEEDREFDQAVIYGADNNIAGVLESVSRFPMMSPRQLVILKEAQALQQAKTQLDRLAPYVEKPNPNTVFVIAFKGDNLNKTSALLKAAKNSGAVVFESPAISDYKIGGVVRDLCMAEKIPIEERAIEALVAATGSSLSKIFSEISKLRVALTDSASKITADLVHDHIRVSREFNDFELRNAILRRDYFQAINIVRHFEENPKANPPIRTATNLFSYFQNLVIASFDPDKSDGNLMNIFGLKFNGQLREVRTGLANYNAAQLVSAIHAIRRFDSMVKGIDSFQKEFPLLLELVITIITL